MAQEDQEPAIALVQVNGGPPFVNGSAVQPAPQQTTVSGKRATFSRPQAQMLPIGIVVNVYSILILPGFMIGSGLFYQTGQILAIGGGPEVVGAFIFASSLVFALQVC
jgi:hypothetical protein